MRRKGAKIRPDLQILPPTSWRAVRALERELGIVLPDEFVEVVTGYSAAVTFAWSLYGRTADDYIAVPPREYEDCMRGGGDFDLWSLEGLPLVTDRLQG
jgi:hypothetical protein